jgi:methylmalonyl-CoA/ethylmalonyl-CoA epimerase
MIVRIDHVAIAVTALDEGLRFWSQALGLEARDVEAVPAERVRVAFLPVGEAHLELVEPTAEDSPVASYLASHGGGMHHLTLAVRDLDAMLERVRARGVEVLGGGARPGARGRRVAFLHPRSTGGVLVELVESDAAGARSATGIDPGSAVLLYLREPQDKLWGVLRRLDAAGAVIEGVDLGSFDDWVAQIERGEESVVGASVIFVPMSRVEKILLDRSSGNLPSLAERFRRRLGRTVQEVLAELSPED